MTVYPDNNSIAAGPEKAVMLHRGSLEVGDVLSDLSANPMELSLLGVQGECLAVAHSKAGQRQHTSAQSACAVHVEAAMRHQT